jgi:hypothetical protein
MPQDVIDRVHALAHRSNANRDLMFTWRDGTAIANKEDNDDDDNLAYDPEDDNAYSDSD